MVSKQATPVKPAVDRDKVLLEQIKKISKRHADEGTRLSLNSIVSYLKKLDVGLEAGENDHTFKFQVYRLINKNKIWFGKPGIDPQWGEPKDPKK